MRNELLLVLSVIIIYGSILLAYRFLGKTGLYGMTAIIGILANIEVLMLISAFGFEQTLGNVMFAGGFLAESILNENEGKQAAKRAVWLGLFTSCAMLVFTQFWSLYTLSPNDSFGQMIRQIFSFTPRLLVSSFLGYGISHMFDVWIYNRIWDIIAVKTGSRERFLWLRSSLSVILAQAINTVVFTLGAFWGVYSASTLIQIMISTYLIYFAAGLLNTPAVYIAKKIKRKGKVPDERN